MRNLLGCATRSAQILPPCQNLTAGPAPPPPPAAADPGTGSEFFVFVGLGNGRVMKFRVIEDPATGRIRQEALLTQRVGKKRVEQVQAVGDIGKLFVLCGAADAALRARQRRG